MDLTQRAINEARENRDRRFTAFTLTAFAVLTAFGTVTRALDGSFAWPMIGVNAVLVYGVHLGFQGWQQKETRLSCAAMLAIPALFLAAHFLR
ncbi:hypothetical protein [Streptomyces sp. NPDC046939]|uniref:hypothetical protein n=1 Tax=Streptomyces sp. NPDC046939 TaxID=3155376 RepID=UPI0033D329B4